MLAALHIKNGTHRMRDLDQDVVYLFKWHPEMIIQGQRLILKTNVELLSRQRCRQMCKIKKNPDLIGPSDPISNLHHIKYAVQENETPLERELRKKREELQTWNQVFWKNHNLSFRSRKQEFEKNHLGKSDNQTLTAEELSVFYKKFLDDNWKTHLNYLLEWYRKNIFVTFLHLRVNIQRVLKRR